jgi:hypothetical protein
MFIRLTPGPANKKKNLEDDPTLPKGYLKFVI